MRRVLHAGLHKTGSTALQQHFFLDISSKNYQYLGKGYLLSSGLIIDESTDVLLFSNEAACGFPYPVTKEFSIDILKTNVNILGIDSIIFVTRNFESWILSLYYQSLNEGYTWSLNDFVKKNRDNLYTWMKCDLYVEKYACEAGLPLLMFDHEELLSNPQEIYDKICDFIGVDKVIVKCEVRENSSKYGVVHINFYRLLNYLFKFKLIRIPFHFVNVAPRGLMQYGALGRVLSMIAKKNLSPQDVERLMR